MKKKLYLLLICLLSLFFISCSEKEKSPEFQPPIKNLQWGMTIDEVIKELDLSEDNINNGDGKSISLIYNNTTVFDQKADIFMFFENEFDIGLIHMRIYFTDLDEKNLVDQLNSSYGEYVAVDDNGIASQWESIKVIDLPQETQDKFKYINIELPSKLYTSVGMSDEARWNQLKESPLVKVTLNKENTLIYGAVNMAVYTKINNEKTYDKLVDKFNNYINKKQTEE